MAKKNTNQVHCDKCASPRGLSMKAIKIQATCDHCGKNTLCSEIVVEQEESKKSDGKVKKTSKTSKPKAPKASKPKASKPKAKTPSIGEQVISILKGARKGMTCDQIIAAMPKGTNAGSVKSAITRGVSKGSIKKLKTKIKSTDGKMETAYSAK